jgi:uncharacterized membrane protein YedE/YeeE
MSHFTPWLSLFGGALIGVASALLLLFNGRVAGISGICAGLLPPERGDAGWRINFVLGLLLSGVAAALIHPEALQAGIVRSGPALALGGFLVGSGAKVANGCTSGHGLCGLSRFSLRSFVAVTTFIATGALTVALVNRLWGGTL